MIANDQLLLIHAATIKDIVSSLFKMQVPMKSVQFFLSLCNSEFIQLFVDSDISNYF